MAKDNEIKENCSMLIREFKKDVESGKIKLDKADQEKYEKIIKKIGDIDKN